MLFESLVGESVGARLLSSARRAAWLVPSAAVLTGCTLLPDVTTFSAATEKMSATTDLAFVEAREVIKEGMLVTLDPGERAALAVSLRKVEGKQLVTDCGCVRAEGKKLEDCLSSPVYRSGAEKGREFSQEQYQVLGGLVCMELSHRQLGLFRSSAASYSGSLKKLVDAGNGGKKAANSLMASVNGIAGIMGSSGLITGQATEIFAAFYGEWAKNRAQKKLREVLPTTDLAVDELGGLLLEALVHLESAFDAGAGALRIELDADEDRWLEATIREVDASEKAAIDFLVYRIVGPQPPGATTKYLQGLQQLDRDLMALRPSAVFECHTKLKLEADVVCRADETPVSYAPGNCDNEELEPDEELSSACCLKAEGCCEEGKCVDFSKQLADRTQYWQDRLKEIEKLDKLFPTKRLDGYTQRRKVAETNELDGRASLAAARISIESWKAAHWLMAKSVVKADPPKDGTSRR